MSTRLATRNGIACAVIAGSMLLSPVPASAGAAATDTPASVAAAGKAGSAEIQPLLLALNDANAVMKRMQSDPAWQKTCLELGLKNDRAGLSTFLKRAAPNSEVNVIAVDDFTITISFTVKGRKVTVCGSNERGCSGNTASIGIT